MQMARKQFGLGSLGYCLGSWLVLAVLAYPARSEDAVDGAFTFILDCSADTGATVHDEVSGLSVSQLDAAKEILLAKWEQMANVGENHASLWLLGHRLAWDDSPKPQLVEQTDYLDTFLGYGVLARLLPGDDVEIVQSMKKVKPADVGKLEMRFSVVQSWGDRPLYLAIARALQDYSAPTQTKRRGIVVITSGANHQWMPQYRTGKDDVLDMHSRHRAPVHVIGFALPSDDKGALVRELTDLAQRTGGTFADVLTPAELSQSLDLVLSAEERFDAVADASSDDSSAVATDQPETLAAVQKRVPVLVRGIVATRKGPVRSATVTLAGDAGSFGPIKTDKKGSFEIADVPAGRYTLKAEGIAANSYLESSVALTVRGERDESPFVEVLLK
jgi:hypothetical protein